MTKTIKELLDEKFDSYHKRRMENKDCPCIEGCSQCEYRNTKTDEIISQVEALVREEVLSEVEREVENRFYGANDVRIKNVLGAINNLRVK